MFIYWHLLWSVDYFEAGEDTMELKWMLNCDLRQHWIDMHFGDIWECHEANVAGLQKEISCCACPLDPFSEINVIYWTLLICFAHFCIHWALLRICLTVTVAETSPFCRQGSQLSRTMDAGVMDTEAETLESPTKPIRSLTLLCCFNCILNFVKMSLLLLLLLLLFNKNRSVSQFQLK